MGYKGMGGTIIDKDGKKDRNEFWNISHDDILNNSAPFLAPQILQETRPLQAHYIHTAHAIALHLLKYLSHNLHLPSQTLSSLHASASTSGDQIRLLHAPPQPLEDPSTALGSHTDFGSVTILFNKIGGLQILPPIAEECQYVRPLPRHAIAKISDALIKFSNGLLGSNIHRVMNPPGEQVRLERCSLVYFMRPGDEVLLKSLGGRNGNGVIPATDAGKRR